MVVHHHQKASLVRTLLNATYVAFREDFYQQSFGTAMESPTTVTMADLVMQDIEQRALSSFLCFGRGTCM